MRMRPDSSGFYGVFSTQIRVWNWRNAIKSVLPIMSTEFLTKCTHKCDRQVIHEAYKPCKNRFASSNAS